MELDNIRVIMEWPTLKNVAYFWLFMGMDDYYHRFIKVLSNISHPITSLQQNESKFIWSNKCSQ